VQAQLIKQFGGYAATLTETIKKTKVTLKMMILSKCGVGTCFTVEKNTQALLPPLPCCVAFNSHPKRESDQTGSTKKAKLS